MTHRIFSKLSARELFAVLLAGIVFVGAPTASRRSGAS
jgi:hypothetical protein